MGSHHSEPEPWVVHRVRALESLLIEKGLLSTEVVDTVPIRPGTPDDSIRLAVFTVSPHRS